jgi:hypothetical protein
LLGSDFACPLTLIRSTERRSVETETVLAGVTVANFESSLNWYERLLGRAPDQRPMDGLAQWRVSDTALFQVLEEPERAGGSLVGFTVADLPAAVAELQDRGITPEDDERTSDSVLFETFIDPDGNKVGLLVRRDAA